MQLMAEVHEIDRHLAEIDRRSSIIRDHRPERGQSVVKRIRAFIASHPGMSFSPRELMKATDANEESIRKALRGLVVDGFLARPEHATYQLAVNPIEGPTDHNSAALLRNWHQD